jgi:hypothetical protein
MDVKLQICNVNKTTANEGKIQPEVHVGALSYLPISINLHFLWRCGSSENY